MVLAVSPAAVSVSESGSASSQQDNGCLQVMSASVEELVQTTVKAIALLRQEAPPRVVDPPLAESDSTATKRDMKMGLTEQSGYTSAEYGSKSGVAFDSEAFVEITAGVDALLPTTAPTDCMHTMVTSEDESFCDNTIWEMVITREGIKQLGSLSLQHRRTAQVILRDLACGRWKKAYLRFTKNTENVKLFRANFSAGGRLLWERTISYSAKLKSYSEIICVWALISDHDKQQEAVDRVKSSHRRGETPENEAFQEAVGRVLESHRKGKASALHKKMRKKSSRKSVVRDDDGQLIIFPDQFEFVNETIGSAPLTHLKQKGGFSGDGDSSVRSFVLLEPAGGNDQQRKCGSGSATLGSVTGHEEAEEDVDWYPPAVPSADSYVLLKFYECTRGLLRFFCSEKCDDSTALEFPFRLSPTEHDICELPPDPLSSILLLGRSGTGKTTCLAYRMWMRHKLWFQHFDVSSPVLGGACTSSSLVHLHQCFLTANPVLRSEVSKYFDALERGRNIEVQGDDGADSPSREVADGDHCLSPPSLSVVCDSKFPLFLTKREWLVILDGTLRNSFFPRISATNKHIAVDVSSSSRSSQLVWGKLESKSLLDCLDEFDSDDEGVEQRDLLAAASAVGNYEVNSSRTHKTPSSLPYDVEVDYEVFANVIWPKIYHKNGNTNFSPALIWCEMTSFIKGSFDAMETGRLTLSQYLEIGHKRAQNFDKQSNARAQIYELYRAYEVEKVRMRAFDLCDLVHHIYREISRDGYSGTPIHELYVDEVINVFA
jgi:hypothetical protein